METKICSQCGRELPLDNFYWKNRAKGWRRSECKECHSGYVKRQYHTKKDLLNEIKAERGCAKCGEKRPWVLDFHHRNPDDKTNTVARLSSNTSSIDTVLKEVEKCECLCANCHRDFHYLHETQEISLEQYLE